jgi:Na+-driven multidrug efflux pump
VSWSVLLGIGAGLVVWALRTPIAGVFTDDAAVTAVAASSLVWVAAMQPICALAFALDGVMVGAGDLWFLAGVMVAAALLFVPVAWLVVLPADTIGWLWAALAGFMALRAAAMWLRFRGTSWSRPGAELASL